jgi:hypothetical protein
LSQLDIRRFNEFLETVRDRGAIAHQDLPVARQFPQFPDVPGRDEAGLQQTMAQQITNPIAVPDISLPSGHRFDVVGVDQQDGTVVFQQIEDWPPVDAGTLNGDVRATGSQEPVSQLQEIRRHSREGPNLFLAFDAEASHDRLGMHIETAAARIHDFHAVSPFHVLRMRTTRKESLMRAHIAWQQLVVPNWFSRSGFSSGFWHQVESDLRSLRTVPSYPYEAPFSSVAV